MVVGAGAGGVVGDGVATVAGRVVGGAVGAAGVEVALGVRAGAVGRAPLVGVVACNLLVGVALVDVVVVGGMVPWVIAVATTFESAATWLTMTPDARPAPRNNVWEIRRDRLNRWSR